MAKKQKPDDDGVSYLGKKIDPELQKRVDEYMELEDEAVEADEQSVENVAEDKEDAGTEAAVLEPAVETSNPDTGTAPLLPTDKLPDEVVSAPAKKSSKIKILHHDDEPEDMEEEPVDASAETEVNDAPEPEAVGAASTKIPVLAHDDEPDEVVVADDEDLVASFDDESDELEKLDDIAAEIPEAEEPDELPADADKPEIAGAPEIDESLDGEDDMTHLDVAEIDELPDEPEEEPIISEVDDLTAEPPESDPETAAAPEFEASSTYKTDTVKSASSIPMDDAVTSQAIADIIASDSDELLGIEDKKRRAATPVPIKPKAKAKSKKQGSLIKRLFKNAAAKYVIIGGLLAAIGALAAIPTTRYYALNAAGVRVSTSLKVLDDKTSLPLKNVELNIDGKSAKTDGEGNVTLEGLRLGPHQLVIKKAAFAELDKKVVLGWGSNPLGEFRILPTGVRYSFVLSDFISEKPVSGGEVSYGEATAKINEKGEAELTLAKIEDPNIDVTIKADNYRKEIIKISTTDTSQHKSKLVPEKKHVFVSKQRGKYDLYQVDVDGKNEEVLVAGSGVEKQDSLAIAPHPSKKIIAYSASRENTRNQDGFLLNTLYIVDTDSKEVKKIAQSERIQFVDWVGDRFVYVKIAQGASEASNDRHRLISYNVENGEEKELASTNYFNDVISVNGSIYYSPAIYKVNGNVGLYKINPDGTNKKTVFQKEVWNIFRTNFDKLSMSVGQDWYELNLTNDVMVKVGGAPSVLKSRVYVPNRESSQSVWIDERDGKTVLVDYAHSTKSDKVLVTQSGIKNPVRWLSDEHLIYRVSDGQETADYIFNVRGGEPKKIRDVTDTAGIDRWYYF